jgi:hypothetical protein
MRVELHHGQIYHVLRAIFAADVSFAANVISGAGKLVRPQSLSAAVHLPVADRWK